MATIGLDAAITMLPYGVFDMLTVVVDALVVMAIVMGDGYAD